MFRSSNIFFSFFCGYSLCFIKVKYKSRSFDFCLWGYKWLKLIFKFQRDIFYKLKYKTWLYKLIWRPHTFEFPLTFYFFWNKINRFSILNRYSIIIYLDFIKNVLNFLFNILLLLCFGTCCFVSINSSRVSYLALIYTIFTSIYIYIDIKIDI